MYQQRAAGDWFLSDDDGPYPASDGIAADAANAGPLYRGPADGRRHEEVRQGYHGPNPKGRKAEWFFTTYSRAVVTPGRKEHLR